MIPAGDHGSFRPPFSPLFLVVQGMRAARASVCLSAQGTLPLLARGEG